MMNPEFVGIENSDDDLTTSSSPSTQSKLDAKTIIARRAAMELKPNSILNLGIGAPEYIAEVAKQAGILDQFTLTVEPGAVGGYRKAVSILGRLVCLRRLSAKTRCLIFMMVAVLTKPFLA